jgi:diguanylate cyclase (GGDEF)-like protein/PAS domain S-box-containing protein
MDGFVDRLVEQLDRHDRVVHDDVSIVMIKTPLRGLSEDDSLAEGEVLPVDIAEAKLHIVEHFPQGIMLTDAEQNILYVNPAFSTITGYSIVEAIGRTPRILRSGRHDIGFYKKMWGALHEQGVWGGEIWNRRKDGTLYLEWVDIYALRDDSGQVSHYLAGFTNITQQRQRDDSSLRIFLYDPLTGLAGKLLLADRGEQAMRRVDRAGRSMAVLFIDLDRFNSINDTLGHDIGDLVLAAVAHRFSSLLRNDDTLSRFGGDEFVCLLPDLADRHDAARVADAFLNALCCHPIEAAGHKFKISVSIGISVYPSDAQELGDLIVEADRAMQIAKRAGGNLSRFYSPDVAVVAAKQLEMEASLDAAVHNGELELHYQPKMHMLRKVFVGAEALVRWRDPKRGLISPGEFIPVAERSDLIAKIGNWVLTRACDAIARWNYVLPVGFHVAVNISPMQLVRCDLFKEVSAALEASGIDPHRLQLEVTESIFIQDTESAIAILSAINELGVSISLDDFGTGFSNLSSLSHLPLDTFKLDQSFVRDIHLHPSKSAIANAVWLLAKGMDKHVVAEGIESCEECMQLKSFGYRIGQGYKFGKPMPESEFFSLMERHSPACLACPAYPNLFPPSTAITLQSAESQQQAWN